MEAPIDAHQGRNRGARFQENVNHQDQEDPVEYQEPRDARPAQNSRGGRRHPIQQREIIDVDNQVLPALQKGKAEFDVPETLNDNQGADYLNAEDIKPDRMTLADPLKSFVTEDICRGIFSSNWNYRDGAIQALKEEIPKGARSDLYPSLII